MKYEDWIEYERKRLRGQKHRPLILHPPGPKTPKPNPVKPIAPNRQAIAPPKHRPWLQFFRSLWSR